MVRKTALLAVLAVLLFSAPWASALTGGPDAFGYTFIDSNSPGGPVFSFAPINTNNVRDAGGGGISAQDDEFSVVIPLGFNFNFYGTNFNQLIVYNDGFISFNIVGDLGYWNVYPIPATVPAQSPGNMIAACWGDGDQLPAPPAQAISFQAGGVAPNRTFTVEWLNRGRYQNGVTANQPYTAQVTLFEGTNNILMQLQTITVDALDLTGTGGAGCIGIENNNGSVGLQYFFNNVITGTAISNTAVLFQPPQPGPRQVTNLALDTPGFTSVHATWSEPGINQSGPPATLARGDLRWSTSPILTQADYNNANIVLGVPAPTQIPGTATQMMVTGLPQDINVYFNIEYFDTPQGRHGPLSNEPTLETLENLPPTQVTDLRVVSIVGTLVTLQWTNTGENLNRGANLSADFRMRLNQGCVSLTPADFVNPAPAGVTVIPNPPTPLAPGVVQQFTFDLGAPFTQFSVGMINYDDPEAGLNPSGAGPVCNQPVCGATGSPTWQPATPGSDTGVGISNTPTNSVDPCLAINPRTNLPGVAWTDLNPVGGNLEIYFRELVGGTWTEFAASGSAGGVSNNPSPSQYPSLAYDAAGEPVIAWQDQNGAPPVIYVRRFSGGAWNELSGSGSANGISGGVTPSIMPSVAVNPTTGQPGVAWSGFQSGNFQVFFREYDGAANWVAFAGSGAGQGVSGQDGTAVDPSVAYDNNSRPVIAWADDTSGSFQIYVRRFNGASWVEMAGSGSGLGISNNTAVNRHPSIQTDASGNPYVVWESDPGNANAEIFGSTFNGAAWVDFGPGSSSGAGISATPMDSRRPSLSKSPVTDRVFFLVWNDYSDPDGLAEVYGKYYADGLWKVIGDASASLGGITNAPLATAHPSGGLAGGATPKAYVAWSGGAGKGAQIYVKSLLLVGGGADSPKEIAVGGGQGAGGQYRVFGNGAVNPPYAPLDLRTEPWAAYNAANGTLHPACGDVEGIGVDDIVLGLGTYPSAGGWVAVVRDNQGRFDLLRWLLFPWAAYNAANGATFPACGDLDDDGRADIVLGQGSYPGGGGGWCAVFGDQANGFQLQGWIVGGFSSYQGANGEVHPAIGHLGKGRNSLALGFGQGSAGLVQVRDDRLHGYVGLGSLTYANAAYNAQNGTTWPTIAGPTALAGPEVIVGPGWGGNGIACIYSEANTAFSQIGSMQLPWGAYDSQQGEMRLSAGSTDASGYPSVVAGLGPYPANGGWLYVFGRVSTGSTSGTWIRYVNGNASYNWQNGETFPAVGQLR